MKTASEEVTDMIFLSKWSSQTLCAGAELGIFDCLSRDGTRTANDIAAETGLDPTLLYRLLRALASLGLLNETSGRHFNLTERGAILRTDAPGSLRYMAMLEGGPEHWAIWKHVPAMVRDGRQNAFMREYGAMAFDHARANPDGYGAVFGRAMSSFSAIQSAWALEALRDYDFSHLVYRPLNPLSFAGQDVIGLVFPFVAVARNPDDGRKRYVKQAISSASVGPA